MGAVTSRHADAIVVTSDNPRGEDPARHHREIDAAIPVAHETIEDRRTAIARAVASAGADDVVLIAEKATKPTRKSPAATAFLRCARSRRSARAMGPMMSLREAATSIGARLIGRMSASIPCRPIAARSSGALFIALRGEDSTGADSSGGKEREPPQQSPRNPMPLREAFRFSSSRTRVSRFGRLAAHWRERFDIPLVAVIAPMARTTVKEMIAAILREHFGEAHALATEGNLNNDIGLPSPC